MKNEITKIRLPGLDELDVIELEDSLDPSMVQFEAQPIEPGRYGEPATITAIIIISVASLKALSAWLMKNKQTKHLKKTVEKFYEDGTREVVTLELDLSTSTAPEAELVKQLGINIDPKLFS